MKAPFAVLDIPEQDRVEIYGAFQPQGRVHAGNVHPVADYRAPGQLPHSIDATHLACLSYAYQTMYGSADFEFSEQEIDRDPAENRGESGRRRTRLVQHSARHEAAAL